MIWCSLFKLNQINCIPARPRWSAKGKASWLQEGRCHLWYFLCTCWSNLYWSGNGLFTLEYHSIWEPWEISLQSNFDYPDLSDPDFLIIQTCFSDPSFSWILISHILCLEKNFFPLNYIVIQLHSELNLFHFILKICTHFAP